MFEPHGHCFEVKWEGVQEGDPSGVDVWLFNVVRTIDYESSNLFIDPLGLGEILGKDRM